MAPGAMKLSELGYGSEDVRILRTDYLLAGMAGVERSWSGQVTVKSIGPVVAYKLGRRKPQLMTLISRVDPT